MVTGQYQPGKLDEALQIFLNSIMPAARQQPGYKGALGLVDRTTGKAIAIGLRETAADMQATEASGYLEEQFAKVAPLLAAPPTVEVYEVSVQEVQKGGPGGYARVMTVTAHPDTADEGIQIVRDSILPANRPQPGFKGLFLLLDRSTGKVLTITLWATEADLLATETSGFLREQLGKAAHVLATQPVLERYEVTIQE